jgi:hypothetical protein
MNTRTYPRTARDAFKGLDYSCAVERPAPRPYPRVLWVVMAAGLIAALLAART